MKKNAETAIFILYYEKNAISAFFFVFFVKKNAEMAIFILYYEKNAISAFFL